MMTECYYFGLGMLLFLAWNVTIFGLECYYFGRERNRGDVVEEGVKFYLKFRQPLFDIPGKREIAHATIGFRHEGHKRGAEHDDGVASDRHEPDHLLDDSLALRRLVFVQHRQAVHPPQQLQDRDARKAQQDVPVVRQLDVLERLVKARPKILRHLSEAEYARQLAAADDDGRRRGEAGYHGDGNEAHDEAERKHAHDQLNEAAEEAQRHRKVRVVFSTVRGDHQRHYGRGSKGHVLARSEQAVEEAASECIVEAILRRQACQDTVGQALRDNHETNGNASDHVTLQGMPRVRRQPFRYRQAISPIHSTTRHRLF